MIRGDLSRLEWNGTSTFIQSPLACYLQSLSVFVIPQPTVVRVFLITPGHNPRLTLPIPRQTFCQER